MARHTHLSCYSGPWGSELWSSCFYSSSAGVTGCTTVLGSCGAAIKPRAFHTPVKHWQLSYTSVPPPHPTPTLSMLAALIFCLFFLCIVYFLTAREVLANNTPLDS